MMKENIFIMMWVAPWAPFSELLSGVQYCGRSTFHLSTEGCVAGVYVSCNSCRKNLPKGSGFGWDEASSKAKNSWVDLVHLYWNPRSSRWTFSLKRTKASFQVFTTVSQKFQFDSEHSSLALACLYLNKAFNHADGGLINGQPQYSLTRLDRHQSVWTGSCFLRQSPVNVGCRRMMEHGCCCWQAPRIWVQTPINGQPFCRQWDAYRFYRPN